MKTSNFLQVFLICVALFFGCAQPTTAPDGGSTSPTCTLTPGTVANGSMTPASPQTVTTGVATAITATPSSGYVFSGWTANPAANASFASAASASTTVTLTGNATITPAFNLKTFTVTYNSNGASGGTVPADGTQYNTGATVTVKTNTGNLVPPNGEFFAGWNTAADGSGTGYATGANFILGSANVILYAWWGNLGTVAGAIHGGISSVLTTINWNGSGISIANAGLNANGTLNPPAINMTMVFTSYSSASGYILNGTLNVTGTYSSGSYAVTASGSDLSLTSAVKPSAQISSVTLNESGAIGGSVSSMTAISGSVNGASLTTGTLGTVTVQ
jgi:hypothetical protein